MLPDFSREGESFVYFLTYLRFRSDDMVLPLDEKEEQTTVGVADRVPRGTREEVDAVRGRFPPGSISATAALPAPRLVLDFRMQADLEGKIALGRSCWGERNWIGIRGGRWSATWGSGTVVVGCQPAPHAPALQRCPSGPGLVVLEDL